MTKHAKKARAGKSAKKQGDKYICGVCGMSIVVDEACGCVDTHDIICCGTAMKSSER